MNSAEVRIEIVIQDPQQYRAWIAKLRAQGLIRPDTPDRELLAHAVAASIPPNSGVEVPYIHDIKELS